MKRTASGKSAASAPIAERRGLGLRDGVVVAALLALAILQMARSGFERGVDLLPSPDALEYAAVAVNLDRGVGPVLHFGGYSYPPRYTEGYPLMLAAAYPLAGHRVEMLWAATLALGLVAIIALYVLAFEMFGRTAAIIAALVMATSPSFVTYSTLVLSDVPTTTVTILAALAFWRALREDASGGRAIAYWALFGLLSGFSAMIRPTNAAILAGLTAALLVMSRRRDLIPSLLAFGIAFLPGPGWQLLENARHFGRIFADGYAFWVPEVYGSLSGTFGFGFLFGPTMPRNPHGNVPVYTLLLAGLDGMLGDPGDPRFVLYPFAAAAFAVVGIVLAIRKPPSTAAKMIVVFGLGMLAALFAIYSLYFFSAESFLLPGCFVLFAACGYGVASANQELSRRWAKTRKARGDLPTIAGAVALDVLLILSLATEIGHRLAIQGGGSQMVLALETVERKIEPQAEIVTNISLQFLDLYAPAPGRDFVGLDSFDSGERFADYHLHRLYAKRQSGWKGPVPPVVLDEGQIVKSEIDALSGAARLGRRVYLLLAAPESPEYERYLSNELDELQGNFTIRPVTAIGPVSLYQVEAK